MILNRDKIQRYNPNKKLYYIVYNDGDKEDYYHNELRDYCDKNIKRYPQKKRWRKRKSIAITNLMQKYAPTEADSDEHTPSLSIENIRAITTIQYTDLYISEDDISSEMIKVCFNILNSDHMTPEEQSLEYFSLVKN